MKKDDKDDLIKKDFLSYMAKTIKRRWWYIILLIMCTGFVLCNWGKMVALSFDNITTYHIIFILWIILLTCPLFSEMEFFGVKLKKEVEKVKEEVKEGIADLKAQIIQMNWNYSSNNQILLNNNFLPSMDQMRELENRVEHQRGEKTQGLNTKDQKSNEDSKEYLTNIRSKIEKQLLKLINKVGYENKQSLLEVVEILFRLEILDGFTADLIKQIVKITDRGIHGEIISDEYIRFIKTTYPEVEKRLKDVSENLCLTACPRCKYVGYSKYENVCPKCGYVYDDY